MTNILFKYKEGDLIAIATNDITQHIINGQNVYLLLKMMANDAIEKVVIKNNHIIISYSKDKVIIEDCDLFLKDQKNYFYLNEISKYQVIQNEINKLKAKKIIAEKKKISELKEASQKQKVIRFIRRTSATGIALTALIVAATQPISYSFIESFNYKAIQNEIYTPKESASVDNDKEKIISINFTSDINNRSSLYVKENYSQAIEKYSRRYGVDSEIVKAILANNIDANSMYIDNEFIGAIKNEYERYVDNSIVAYNYDRNEYELYAITKDSLIDKDKYIKVICMLLESKLRLCNYNVVAAIQCMNESENEFKDKLIAYGKWKYSDDNTIEKTSDNYFKLVVADLNDLKWLDMFTNADGNVYAIKVLEHIAEGASIRIKQTNNEIIDFKIRYNYTNLDYS